MSVSNFTEECLITLAEECAEVIQIISKIQRFGMTSKHPNDSSKTNLDRLHEEIGDVLTMIDFLKSEKLLNLSKLDDAQAMKRLKFKKFSTYYWDENNHG